MQSSISVNSKDKPTITSKYGPAQSSLGVKEKNAKFQSIYVDESSSSDLGEQLKEIVSLTGIIILVEDEERVGKHPPYLGHTGILIENSTSPNAFI